MNRTLMKTAAAFSAILIISSGSAFTADAEVTANPVISRNCPVYTGGSGQATAANDEHYFSFWNAQTPDYIAYDLSGVPEENRQTIDAVWYNTSAYDLIGNYGYRNMEPSDYTIEVNAAEGGAYPEEGWVTALTVEGNTLGSRQHIVDFEGYNWIRLSISAADGNAGGNASVNFDIHDVSDGISDSWIFFGDSITAGGMNNCYGTGFATHINQLDENYFPVQENAGIGGITSTDGRNNIDRWLSTYPGKYVSIAYGTNDAWGNQTGAEKYYENTVYMIDAVLEAGKIPVLPTIPYATETGVNTYLDDYNAMVQKIYEEYPEVVKGPDFDAYFCENPDMLSSDGVHPSSEGYAEMRVIWAETMYERVYCDESYIEPVAKGDVNLDGKFGILDIVVFQKYLVRAGSLGSAENGDMNSDGSLNIYDLLIMKSSF